MTELEKARNRFKEDIFATEVTGILIDEVGCGSAVCSLDITPRHLNAAGTVMGGVTYTLADFTFAVAANHDGPLTVTADAHMRYFASPKGKKLTARSRLIKDGKRTCFYDIDVFDELGTHVACLSVTGVKVT